MRVKAVLRRNAMYQEKLAKASDIREKLGQKLKANMSNANMEEPHGTERNGSEWEDASMKSVLGGQAEENQIAISDITLDLNSQSILKEGESIPLTYTEFKILELLATHKKKIYSLDNIYQSIWEEEAVGDSAIMVHIKNIRKKLGDNSRSPKYIKTAWGRGYYIEG